MPVMHGWAARNVSSTSVNTLTIELAAITTMEPFVFGSLHKSVAEEERIPLEQPDSTKAATQRARLRTSSE
jgi:hypothetical protein